jgi:predicted metal-binding membrane protein
MSARAHTAGASTLARGRRAGSAPVLAGLLGVSALAWAFVAWGHDRLPAHGPTMGLGLAAYVGLWTLMTAAMMLPTISHVAFLYLELLRREAHGLARTLRLGGLALGYLLVWAVVGVPAYAAARGTVALGEHAPDALPWLAAAVLALASAFQFSRLKQRCLDHCRSPLAFVSQFGNDRRRLRDVRVGVVHGAYCAGCCAALMLALAALGAIDVVWMAVLAAIVVLEKTWRHGRTLGHALGVVLLAYAVLVPIFPAAAPGPDGGRDRPRDVRPHHVHPG